ncbi:unnamed protein product [Eruca vesicaria subsp. sativa]|uniref:Uncharacterized protein n=1 Tax=Eruca vesicaria subsp. sativa TaxID=29727 RepID=A0ABC8M1F8_ERUVS|nr:unnamed protein product [Eruca vesicaria subsp. sativa]
MLIQLSDWLGFSKFVTGIEENAAESSLRLTRITKELDKGKGHVSTYSDPDVYTQPKTLVVNTNSGYSNIEVDSDDGTECNGSKMFACFAPLAVSTVFRLGPSSEGRVIGNQGVKKYERNRPPSWRRNKHPNLREGMRQDSQFQFLPHKPV